jgi:hypothetical protein
MIQNVYMPRWRRSVDTAMLHASNIPPNFTFKNLPFILKESVPLVTPYILYRELNVYSFFK